MALSDEERRRLEKLEQELAATDPDLDRHLQSGWSRNRASPRTIYGVLAVLAGFTVVIAGIMTQLPVVGVAGFLLMVAGASWFLSGLRKADLTNSTNERRAEGDPGPSDIGLS
ncbi:UNVERIFIED_CONTAM: Flp pilus assembly protein TadB [Jeotgalibacillus campisalis]